MTTQVQPRGPRDQRLVRHREYIATRNTFVSAMRQPPVFQRRSRIRLHRPAVDTVGDAQVGQQSDAAEGDMSDLVGRDAQRVAELRCGDGAVGPTIGQRSPAIDVVEPTSGGEIAVMLCHNEIDERIRPTERRVDADAFGARDEFANPRIVGRHRQLYESRGPVGPLDDRDRRARRGRCEVDSDGAHRFPAVTRGRQNFPSRNSA